MAFNNPARLTLDAKVQDRLREWFSKRGLPDAIQLKSVQLGDSDVNYEMSQQVNTIRVLNAPYQVQGIKHKLTYTGATSNVSGKIETYYRHVNDLGQVGSFYTYPTNLTLTLGVYPPSRGNQVNQLTIPFNTFSNTKEGFIVFNQTLPDGYFTPIDNIPMRLKEEYDFTISVYPTGWEFIIDQVNGSIFIAKPDSYVFLGMTGTILIKGHLSSLTRTIDFNY